MSATYDYNLKTDTDWVRFLSGDRNIADPRLQDEEIQAILAEEANKYFAAARVCEAVIAMGKNAVSKTVGNLSISYGDSPESAYVTRARELRERGAELLLKTSGSHVLRNL